jgi:branched-chain amino acid transport system ATP-binding protein
MKLVNRIIVLSFGSLIAEGLPEDVVRNKEVVRMYIGKEAKNLVS